MKEISITRKNIIWNKWNRDHIAKHSLTPRQAEEALYDANKIVLKSHSNRLKILGRCGKRLLTVFLSPDGKKWYMATARDMSKKERRYYYQINNIPYEKNN